jgi:hypothetical protein
MRAIGKRGDSAGRKVESGVRKSTLRVTNAEGGCGAGALARVFLGSSRGERDQANSETGGPDTGRSGW